MKQEFKSGKLPYTAPEAEVMDLRVESGIATSFAEVDDGSIDKSEITDFWNDDPVGGPF